MIEAADFPAFWVNKVNSGAVGDVVALYNEKAILIPTFSPYFVKDREGLRNYFDQLSAREGLQVKLQENSITALQVGGQSYVIGGIYSFEFNIDGNLTAFPSRFTFAVDLAADSPILHHHSSQIPGPPPA